MELYSDDGFDDMEAGYPVDYQTSQLTGFDGMKACFEADGTRVSKLV